MRRAIPWCLVLVSILAPGPVPARPAQPSDAATTNDPAHTNPTGLLIQPRRNQTPDRQQVDQLDCYLAAREDLDWDPYLAYDELVAEGYAVALTRGQLERGLIAAATRGAVTGAVAGEILGFGEIGQESETGEDLETGEDRETGEDLETGGGTRTGEEIGVAVSLARYLIRAGYLREPATSAERRVISRFERELRNWERTYAHCLRQKGYRIADP